ncbi:MAG: GNAT family N-acetyltransferase [Acidobacteriota bacterium]
MFENSRLPTLAAERVELRWLVDSDVPALFEIFSDAEVARFWSSPAQRELAEAEKLLAEIRRDFEKRDLFQWGVARRRDDRVIGTCTLAGIDTRNRRAEIGFALGRSYWKRGYMMEALPMLLDFAFDELDLHRLEGDVDPRNQASIKALERLGFQREGYLRERWIVGGEICDTVYYGLLDREWRASRK